MNKLRYLFTSLHFKINQNHFVTEYTILTIQRNIVLYKIFERR